MAKTRTSDDVFFTKADVDILRDIGGRWDELSENPNATWCMTDHCHVERDELENIASKMEKYLTMRQEASSGENQD